MSGVFMIMLVQSRQILVNTFHKKTYLLEQTLLLVLSAASEAFLASRAVSPTLSSHHKWIKFLCPSAQRPSLGVSVVKRGIPLFGIPNRRYRRST
jgi:hypothetical protein